MSLGGLFQCITAKKRYLVRYRGLSTAYESEGAVIAWEDSISQVLMQTIDFVTPGTEIVDPWKEE